MRQRQLHNLGLIAAAIFAALSLACASQATGSDLLRALHTKLIRVRDLPKGSRPNPPDVRLETLVGLGREDVRAGLGAPDPCDPDIEDECNTGGKWNYQWGPPNPEPTTGDGYITVSAGGPWLLVVEFSVDQVASARWMGQR